MQRVLEVMARMVLRLAAALVGSGGEQVPESFSYATASSAIVPLYDDSVFDSSAVPRTTMLPSMTSCTAMRSPRCSRY
jgi:hypothetical protein